MKAIITTVILLFMSAAATAEVIDKPLADITVLMSSGSVDQLVIDGVPVAGARYSAQMEEIANALKVNVYAATDTDPTLWFADANGTGSVVDRLK